MMRPQLMRMIKFLTPDHREKWAQAMCAEISAFSTERKAIIFALGCLFACFRFHLEMEISPFKTWSRIMQDKFTISAFISGVAACLTGLAYLAVSGAPGSMLIVNGTALVLGMLIAIAIMVSVQNTKGFVTIAAVTGSVILLGTATFGHAVEDARRWVSIGPFFIQTSLIFLPLIALCFARIQNIWTTLAVVTAGFAIAIQPDRAMAAMLFAAVAVICWLRPGQWTFSAAICCAIGLLATLFQPDRIPAVPFVDHILWTAFDLSIMAGLALWIGCLILVSPIFFVQRNERSAIHFTFTACWVTLIAVAAMGAYPTPVVGYGASAVMGYFVSLIIVRQVPQSDSVADALSPGLSETDKGELPLKNSRPAFVP